MFIFRVNCYYQGTCIDPPTKMPSRRPMVKYLGVSLNASLQNDDDIQRQVKSLYCAANKLKEPLLSAQLQWKTLHSVPIACQYVLTNSGANKQTSMKRLQVVHNNAFRIMHHIPRNAMLNHTRLTTMSGTLMRCLETSCLAFFIDVNLYIIYI